MKSANDLARLRLLVTGRVQGVYCRAATAARADALGITGYVRNLADGSVEVVAEGARKKLEQLYRWTQHGPPDANVTAVFVSWGTFRGEFAGFAVR